MLFSKIWTYHIENPLYSNDVNKWLILVNYVVCLCSYFAIIYPNSYWLVLISCVFIISVSGEYVSELVLNIWFI